MDRLNLLLAIHCHQPVGNFGIVFSKAYEAAYLPFIETLEKHPNIKISLHYSGSLLDWLELTHPEFLKKLKNLVKRQQVEILAGGYYEPILSLIPQSDAQAQIEMLKSKIKDLFAFQADGCWLSERIWEPKLPSILNKAGIKWTIVDDSHFESAGLIPENLSGYYISEDEGRPLAIFPASERLRYLMPFKLPKETIDYLRNLYEHKIRCVCFADDGEKFGLWPGTNKWVYEQKWLDNFFSALEENASWLRIRSFNQYLNEHSPAARIYLSCASYREMMVWSGGYFRNFLLKYEEANWMHKRMLHVSKKIQSIAHSLQSTVKKKPGESAVGSRLNAARQHLYMAQNNDAYWHGVFGGLYLNHLRSCVYSHIIEAEKAIGNLRSCKIDALDLDYDGRTEIILSSKYLSCVFAPHRGGALLELDYNPKSINLINTLMRRRETYHQKLKQKTTNAEAAQAEPQSIHHLERVKQGNLEKFLFYDLFGRHCCLDHFLDKHTRLEQFLRSEYIELGDFIHGEYGWSQGAKSGNKIGLRFQRSGRAADCPIKLTKQISLIDNDLVLRYTVKNESKDCVKNLFGIEFNLSVYDDQLSSMAKEVKTNRLKINDAWNEISLEFNVSSPASVWHFPVETISDSETGIEKTYQELCLLFNWQLDIAPYSDWSVRLGLGIKE
jgi:alpha-amylase